MRNLSPCAPARLSTPKTSQHVATGSPNASTMSRPTKFRYVASKCCDRLARAAVQILGQQRCVELLRSFGRCFTATIFSIPKSYNSAALVISKTRMYRTSRPGCSMDSKETASNIRGCSKGGSRYPTDKSLSADSVVCFVDAYPLESDLSSG